MADEPAKPDPSNEDLANVFLEAGYGLHYSAIGKVASEWAYIEFMIDRRALEVANIPYEIGGCFTAQISGSGRKLDAYIALVRHLGVRNLNTRLEAFAKRTNQLAEQRNRIVHDPWLVEGEVHPSRLEVTARKTLRYEVVTVKTEEVTKFWESLTDHVREFGQLHDAVIAELSTLRGKLPATSP